MSVIRKSWFVGCLLFICGLGLLERSAEARRAPSFRQRLVDIRVGKIQSFSRVVLFVSAPVGGINHDYIPARKKMPARVYMDLTPCVPLRKWSRVPYWVGNRHIGRIRVARNTLQTTRIVLELKRTSRYRVRIIQNPMRILIDVSHQRWPAGTQSRLPTWTPSPWRGGRRKVRWRHKHKHPKSSRYALRHRGPLPSIPFPFKVRRIAVDAGHGGREDGAVGRRLGLREKNITLDLAKRVVRLLRRRYKVDAFLIRRRDRQVPLSRRAAIARQRKADLLLSIHINAHTNRNVSGLSTYILDWNSRSFAAQLLSSDPMTARENQGVHPRRFGTVSSILASLKRQSNLTVSRILGIAIQRGMVQQVRKQFSKIKDLGVRKGLFYLLFAAQMPGVLIEASYLSNAREERLLRTRRYRRSIALGIVRGVGRFLRVARRSTRKKK